MCMDEQTVQKGKIGIVLVSTWMAPFSKSSVDRLASRRALDFMLGCANYVFLLLVLAERNGTSIGVGERDNSTMPVEDALKDYFRIKYHYPHLFYVRKAIRDGVNLKGYIAWSILDNFEWALGYTLRYGINYVDYNNGLKRSSKFSATWFQNFLKK
ncbi:hypothetical protein F0562_035008 [Nyssa sinensis]|uniref:Beta-glucosidase n=1 Tax=Nyssa sinensis TaxID=561372 RepID=A0A5J5AB38_9ASTE|nr:hypothetical protein F0562_035008 [Nyssa sinensis]